jgi:hypothetical protein
MKILKILKKAIDGALSFHKIMSEFNAVFKNKDKKYKVELTKELIELLQENIKYGIKNKRDFHILLKRANTKLCLI